MSRIKTAVILAAGMGIRICDYTEDKIPKGLIKINNKTIIQRSIEKLKSVGIEKIYIVTGHLSRCYENEFKDDKSIIIRRNKNYKATGSMTSLSILSDELNEDFLLLEGDLVYEVYALVKAIDFKEEDCVLLSSRTNSGDECFIEVRDDNLYKISKDISEINEVYGELVGISKISNNLYKNMIKQYKNKISEDNEKLFEDSLIKKLKKYDYEDIIFEAAKNKKIGYLKVNDLIWGEVDNISQLERVKNIVIPKIEKVFN